MSSWRWDPRITDRLLCGPQLHPGRTILRWWPVSETDWNAFLHKQCWTSYARLGTAMDRFERVCLTPVCQYERQHWFVRPCARHLQPNHRWDWGLFSLCGLKRFRRNTLRKLCRWRIHIQSKSSIFLDPLKTERKNYWVQSYAGKFRSDTQLAPASSNHLQCMQLSNI